MTTVAPKLAMPVAAAWPMPDVAPVMRQILFVRNKQRELNLLAHINKASHEKCQPG
jgi:hypothetical protein